MNEIASAIPTLLSLIVIEGLLSIDNALAIAAMASGLPPHQQKKALRLGIVGAYAMRGLCLALAAWIAGNTWIKAVGAAYLVYLMISHLCGKHDESSGIQPVSTRNFWGTIAAIELMDLSLSLDNVVAAVALDTRLWVVCAGVFIGILALRFVAGYCVVLIERFPVLKKTAFVLVGFVGALLLLELWLGDGAIPSHSKFVGIFAICAISLLISKPQVKAA